MEASLYSRFKKYQYTTAIPLFLVITDAILIVASLQLVYQHTSWLSVTSYDTLVLLGTNTASCWLVAGMLVSAYQIEHLGRNRKLIAYFLAAGTIYVGLLTLLLTILPSLTFSLTNLLILSSVAFPTLLVKIALLHFYRFYRHQNPHQKKAVIIGYTQRGRDLGRYFSENRSLPQIFLGYFDDKPDEKLMLSEQYLGSTQDIKKYCQDNGVREIYYVMRNNSALMNDLATFADRNFIYFGIVPDVGGLNVNRRIDTQLYNDSRIPVISTRRAPLRLLANAQIKRGFDVLFSSVVLLFLVPFVFPFIALAIKAESSGPVFFRQLRPGRDNKLFWCLKFRTMVTNAAIDQEATKDDRRITRVGSFLRKTSLDELPQFINVLLGDMSVVGPRPNLIKHLEVYGQEINDYPLRHQITPGITGYAQISGYRGETRGAYLMQKRVDYDMWYIEHWSLAFDLKIIGRTIWNVVAGEENAY